MTDPFAHLQSLAVDELESIDLAELEQPWDDNPDVAGVEVNTTIGLSDDRGYFRRPTTRTFADLRTRPEAVRHLERLPVEGEDFEAVISGRYALWDLIPAILEKIAPQTIETLYIATLSFSASNAAEMLDLLDSDRIKSVGLLVSHYFKAQNKHLYDTLVPKLLERGHKVLAMRTHAKILLVTTTDGIKYAIRSSANLRSCKNCETFTMSRDAACHDFHQKWIAGELLGVTPERKP